MKRIKKGFTIVELVIVIGVIGILSAILIPTFVNLTKNAENSRIKSDLANSYAMYIADAADGYFGDAETSTTPLVAYSQEEVVLLAKLTDTEAFSYTTDKGWATEAKVEVDIDGTDATYASVAFDVVNQVSTPHQFGRYYVLHKIGVGE